MLLVAMGVFLMCLCVYQGFLNINIPQHLSPGDEAFGVFNTAVVPVTSSVNTCEKRMCFSLKQESVRPAAWDGGKTVRLEALKKVSVLIQYFEKENIRFQNYNRLRPSKV